MTFRSWSSAVVTFDGLLNEETEPAVVHSINTDPLAVILQFKSLGDWPSSVTDFRNCVLDPQWLIRAEEIRSYYMDKIATQKLSNTYRDTPFKRDLAVALKQSAQQHITMDNSRLLYRLDDFYTEDTAMSELASQYENFDGDGNSNTSIADVALVHVRTVLVIRGGHKIKKYFFTDKHGVLYCLDAANSNNLNVFVDLVVNTNSALTVRATIRRTCMRDHNFGYIQLATIKKISQ